MPLSRRHFVESALALAAAAVADIRPAAHAAEAAPSRGSTPGQKLRVATIGVNGQGASHVGEWLANPDVDFVAVCDCDPSAYVRLCEKHFKNTLHPPAYVQDVRRLLDRKDIDAVSIATPNHWHALMAIWAMQVVRQSLQNASSISGLLLTTEAIVAELPEKEEEGLGHSH